MKKTWALLLSTSLLCSAISIPAAAQTFSDMPPSHWAYQNVEDAAAAGIMNGMDSGYFGTGQTVTRAQFAQMLSNLFGWNASATASPFSDVQDTSSWYYTAVNTASAHGATDVTSGSFRPNEGITRRELAVMLVKALGYDALAGQVSDTGLPFTDVSTDKGYITIAYDFGIISGKSATSFEPEGYATREEAAAMMMRLYERQNQPLAYQHAFYAFSSFSQKEIASSYDAVSYGWSRMVLENGVPVVNTLSTGGNEWVVPSGYEDVVAFYDGNGVEQYLNVFCSAEEADSPMTSILTDPTLRSQAVAAIVEEATTVYRTTGTNFYDGVTIDFEGLRGNELKTGFTAFLTELNTQLDAAGKKLQVAVSPKLKNSSAYYDGYDLSAIGTLADHVIIMAYDYAPTSLSETEMASGFTTTPVTPFDEIYYAIKTTVFQIPKEKVVLGLSIDSAGWNVVNGVITNSTPITISSSQLRDKLNQTDTISNYSRTYHNPYLTYPENGGTTTLWYENALSMQEKVDLAKLFGISGTSIWRLGLIPDYSSSNLNVAQVLKSR